MLGKARKEGKMFEMWEVDGGIFIVRAMVMMRRIWWSNCKPKPEGVEASNSRRAGTAMW